MKDQLSDSFSTSICSVNHHEKYRVQAMNRTMLLKLVCCSGLMFGFAYALQPLYKTICEVTGINVLTQKDTEVELFAKNTQVDLTRKITVEFDANSQGTWKFKPLQNSVVVHPGELVQVNYEITNTLNQTVIGQAIPSYAPSIVSRYFKKLECFCFKQQSLQPFETKKFPVVFIIDPALSKDIATLTLSYTFFEVASPQ
jgi:cytochrome c oxidase assembly protein subunit 11